MPFAVLLLGLLCGCSATEFGGISPAKDKSGADDSADSDDAGNIDGKNAEGDDGDQDLGTDDDGDDALAESDADTSGCIRVPGSTLKDESSKSGTLYRTTYFHENVAVDPGKTGRDLATKFKLTPYPVSPDEKLAKSVFTLSKSALKAIIDDGTTEIEYFAFAHQFDKGLDKISLKFKTRSKTLSDVSSTNIYSAYGYISIKNMELKDGVPYGDVDLYSFNYNPNGNTALDGKLRVNPSVQDATGIVGPASEATTPKVSEDGVKLDGFTATIQIGADSYDSVQYRALRANLWAPDKAPKVPDACD